jgi:hypothetical protein
MNQLTKSGWRSLVTALTAIVLLAACSSYGPRSMDRDQLDYGYAIGNNWKNQMLANIVRLRYVDMPVFVDVGSIVSGYSLETSVNGRLGFSDNFTGGNSQGLGAQGKFTDRPTITYMPKTGDDYLKAILEPVAPKKLLALIQAGYSSQLLFTWAVEYVSLMQDLQAAGAVGFELDTDPRTSHDIVFVLNKEGLPESAKAKSHRAGELLGLEPGRQRFRVIYAPFKTDSATLSIQTRSVIQMMTAMAGFVDVPAENRSISAPGYDVAAADLASKRVFTLMLFITTLTNQASDDHAPVLTIPTQ